MRALCIDDEVLALNQTVYVCQKSECFEEVIGFNDVYKALECIKENTYDVIFMDIDMPQKNGIELAVEIKTISPASMIVFVTGYSHYAVDAFKIHAQGYLCKPINESDIIREMSYWTTKEVSLPQSGIFIQTFGNFEVIVDGQIISFERQKSKEILAYLVNKKGTGVTRSELASVLWEESLYDHSKQKQLDVYIRSLTKTLKEYGIAQIIAKERGVFHVVPSSFSCDFYDLIAGKAPAVNAFAGSYMDAYSWAEPTLAFLHTL